MKKHRYDNHEIQPSTFQSMGENFFAEFTKQVISEEYNSANDLLRCYLETYLSESGYPPDIGSTLFDILTDLPQEKRAQIKFPLIPASLYDRLIVTSDKSDLADTKLLLLVSSGNSIKTLTIVGGSLDLSIENHLDQILQKIDEINLTNRISLPVDSARSSFAIESTTIGLDKFEAILISFYSHLLSSLRKNLSKTEPEAIGAEAYALLNRAYSRKGGIKAAHVEITDGVNGGLRDVFDAMADQIKYEEKEAYVNYVLKTVIDPLDWDSKVNLMKSLLEKLSNNLPEEIVSEFPERYVSNWETIVRAYVRSIEQVKSILKLF